MNTATFNPPLAFDLDLIVLKHRFLTQIFGLLNHVTLFKH